jgi:protein-arginine kinase activator protein McsA
MLISSFVRTSNTSGGDELFDLKRELTNAVETENFEKAIEIRDQIKKLENNQETINNLKQKMDECIKNQDFETAIKYRDEINKLR